MLSSRTDTEHARWSRGVERDAEVRKACRAPDILEDPVVQKGGRGKTTAKGADGSSACPGDSSHERGDAGASSHPWDIQQADKSIRVRNAGERLLPRPRFGPATSLVGLNHRPCAVNFQTVCGMLAWLASGRGSGLLPKRSARSLWGGKEQEYRLALWPR